jgi:putative aldouronate transport system permease protein
MSTVRVLSKRSGRLEENGASYRVFSFFNGIFLLFIMLITAYPMYYVLVASFSDASALAMNAGNPLLYPLSPISFRAYFRVFENPMILTGYGNTAFVIIVGVTLNIALTAMGAYFLSLKGVPFSTIIMFLIVFTRYFSGGMIPEYLNVRDLGLIDSRFALIIPGLVNTYNLIIMRTAFQNVPESLIESAKLDGARHYRILWSVALPLCAPTIAVLVLYYGVAHWNSWFAASVYIRNRGLWPLQLVMREILISIQQSSQVGAGELDELAQLSELIKYALIVIGTAPILMLYPILQRHFVKGVMIGAIKG